MNGITMQIRGECTTWLPHFLVNLWNVLTIKQAGPNFIESSSEQKHFAYQNMITSQNTVLYVQSMTGTLRVFAEQKLL